MWVSSLKDVFSLVEAKKGMDYMKKIVEIKGMTCEHCQRRVDKALNDIEGIEAKVNLKKNNATLNYSKDVDDQVIKDAIDEAGYEVTSIKEKKGLFG